MTVTGAAQRPISDWNARQAHSYEVGVVHDWNAARARWDTALAGGVATPFQHGSVLDAWYRAMARRPEIEPLIVTVHEAGGAHALSLPLILLREGKRRTIAFADLGLIDYNAPVLGPAAPQDAAGAAALWRVLRRALPPADLIDLRKMPETIGGRVNPLALLRALPCPLNGNVVRVGDSWEEYHRSLKRTVRKELERSWRVFERHPGATFGPVTEPDERRRILAAIEVQQPLRMQSTKKAYVLDDPSCAAFYRNLVEAPEAHDTVVLTALTAGEEVAAALLGLRFGGEYIMVRISNAEGQWSNASPGKLIIDKSMEWLHGSGHRHFDFSIGNYDYKQRFGVEPTGLVDLVRPLTPRGLPVAAEAHARVWFNKHPKAKALAQKVLSYWPGQ